MPDNLTCVDINGHFASESNRFNIDIHQQLRESSLWYNLIPKAAFPQGMGFAGDASPTLRELTIDRIYQASAETDWQDVVSYDDGGPTPNASTVQATEISFGHTIRTWNLQKKDYKTPCVNLDALKHHYEVNRQIERTIEALSQFSDAVHANRARAEYARLVPKLTARVGFGPNGLAGNTGNSMTPASLLPPTHALDQRFLDQIYDWMMREGSGLNPVTRDMGAPTLGLVTSRETSDAIIRAEGVRDDYRYADPGELLRPLGVNRVYKGYVHMIDTELPRFNFTANQWVRVLPYISETASSGFRAVPNPAYATASYEMSYIYSPDVYECVIQKEGPSIPGADFEDHPYYYTGQVFWLNIKHEQYNPLGKVGRWLILFQNGSRPKLPNRGRVIMHKRCINDVGTSCSYA